MAPGCDSECGVGNYLFSDMMCFRTDRGCGREMAYVQNVDPGLIFRPVGSRCQRLHQRNQTADQNRNSEMIGCFGTHAPNVSRALVENRHYREKLIMQP